MKTLNVSKLQVVSGGISDADPGSGLNYSSSPSDIEQNVADRESISQSFVDGIESFFAGVQAGL